MKLHDLRPQKNLTVVTMSLGTQTLAIPAHLLREILDPLPVTRVPGAGAHVPGVVNVRGSVVPLADLKQVLTIPDEGADDRRRILVLEVGVAGEATVVAIEADAVHEVSTIETAVIEPVPASASSWPPEYLTGLYRGPQGFILLPNLETIFSNLASRSLAAQP
ncbi:chemotaxis protein CheW [Rhodobacteraceae bacterium HSP-20]|uniref:Chemotaxis protein CheW n=1 Tax=Paragemmobacter amnigenus TaxID=2852097 RepID=A0ABS6J551_9RHOB|nr:chemotaxis protein CheW [Rhodobacter amnigenus]MBU9697515.1 chemotaxis protein CheW [Rhodobacter amnigenus]MBV4388742.1 chemotaxis protein CheW [Rhodobacter amnigenus]